MQGNATFFSAYTLNWVAQQFDIFLERNRKMYKWVQLKPWAEHIILAIGLLKNTALVMQRNKSI